MDSTEQRESIGEASDVESEVERLLSGSSTLTRAEALTVARLRIGGRPRVLDGARQAVLIASAAALLVQLLRPVADSTGPRDLGGAILLVIGAVAVLLGLRHGSGRRRSLMVAALLVAGGLAIGLPPFPDGSSSAVLAVLHLPVVLWAGLALLRTGSDTDAANGRMQRLLDHARLSGETGVLLALFALGGGLLLALTLVLLEPAGVDEDVIAGWLLPSGAAGALVIATWLADGGWRDMTRIAPLLATVFTPLFALALTFVTAAHVVAGTTGAFDRELLVVFDGLLVVVLALVVFGAAVRDESQPARAMDLVRLIMIVAALVLDVLVLSAMVLRVDEFGLTPNRVAALGLNLVLLVNLAGSAALTARALWRRDVLASLARWQAANLPVLALWAAFVVALLPALFGFA